MQTEAPILEDWLVAAPYEAGHHLAERISEALDIHSRAEPPNAQLTINTQDAEAIRLTLAEHHADLDSHPGLLSLLNTLSTLEH